MFWQLGKRLWICALIGSGSWLITALGFRGFWFSTLLVEEQVLGWGLCFLRGCLWTMERNQSWVSLSTHPLKFQPLLWNLITVFCPLTHSWSTLMSRCYLTMKPFMIFAADHWTLRDLLTPISIGLFLRYN